MMMMFVRFDDVALFYFINVVHLDDLEAIL